MATNKEIVNAAIEKANKTFGKGIVRQLGKNESLDLDSVSTGSDKLDNTLGVGGLPKGRITDAFGEEGTGKTSLTLHIIANVQKNGGIAAFVDAEQAFNTEYAKKLGVDVSNNFLIVQPDYGEQALEVVEELLNIGKFDIIVIDSVPALVPKAELEGNLEDDLPAAQARLMSKALRRCKNKVKKANTALIFINQTRSNFKSGWGRKNEKATGGKALKFYSDVRMEIQRGKTVTNTSNEIIGYKMKIRTVKNKVAIPYKSAEVTFRYGIGIDFTRELIDEAIEKKIIIQNASWFYYENEENTIGQGISSVIEFVNKNKKEIKKKLEEE